MTRISSLSERPEHHGPRRLVHWINPAGERKVHSLVDKVYKRKNLEVAWEKVKRNRGAGGVDGEDLAAFEASLDANLDRLHRELRDGKYVPQPVLQRLIPKAGQPGKFRPLGIPTIYDRVCQQALLNRLGPIFEPVFDDANYGYRQGRSTHGALRKIWRELDEGYEWVVDADLADFFGSVDHEKLLELVNQRVSDGRVLGLLRQMLRAGVVADGRRLPTDQGTPQGGIVSPLLSNILLTPFDWEMRRRGYRLTRYADDWLITCRNHGEARAALEEARRILAKLGVTLNTGKTRIVHVRHGFEFLGYKIKQGKRPLRLQASKRAYPVVTHTHYMYGVASSGPGGRGTKRGWMSRSVKTFRFRGRFLSSSDFSRMARPVPPTLLAMSPLPLTPSFTRTIGSTLDVVGVGDNRIGTPRRSRAGFAGERAMRFRVKNPSGTSKTRSASVLGARLLSVRRS